MSATKPRQPRKQPRQARSRATVDALLDAAARVLVQEGYGAANTNRIAEVAGISVGSLYQYFPSKEALIVALRQRHAAQMGALLQEQAQKVAGASLSVAVQTLVHAVVQAHMIDPALHRALGEQVPRAVVLDPQEDIGDAMRATLLALLLAHRPHILPHDLELAGFVLMHTVEALVHAALDAPAARISMLAMEDEIQALVLRYLTGVPVPCASPKRTRPKASTRREP